MCHNTHRRTPSGGDELTCVTTRTDAHLLGTHLQLLYRFKKMLSAPLLLYKLQHAELTCTTWLSSLHTAKGFCQAQF